MLALSIGGPLKYARPNAVISKAWRGITRCLVGCLLLLESQFIQADHQPAFAFINPGLADESFWQDVDLFMTEVARQYELPLQILHANRDHVKMIHLAEQLASQAHKPEYLLLVNEKGVAGKMLEALTGSGIRVMMLLNDLSPEEKRQLLLSDYWKTHWLGSLIPDNYFIGFETAQALALRGKQTFPGVAALSVALISGDKVTQASVERESGAINFLSSDPAIKITQTVYGQWQESRAEEQMSILLQRYPDLKLVWTANDHMAFGAMRAARARGKTPGKDILFATHNTSEKVLQALADDEVGVLGGGAFSSRRLGVGDVI